MAGDVIGGEEGAMAAHEITELSERSMAWPQWVPQCVGGLGGRDPTRMLG